MKTAKEILNKRIIKFPSGLNMQGIDIERNVLLAMEEYASQSKWVSCAERLPESGLPVLILTDYGKVDVCRLRLEEGRIIIWVNDMRPQHTNGSVTHWQPLPKPPVEKS